MLLEQRLEEIVKLVEEKRSVTVQELTEQFSASESTIRRDLTTLHSNGRLIKVHGGAIALDSNFNAKDDDIESRQLLFQAEKSEIARYAASLIKANDFVYLDSGTTTEHMIPYLSEKNAVYVTNSISIAKKLAKSSLTSFIIGGELKPSTEAIVGSDAILNLSKYNFTKGFFGTNGISAQLGFTTPDVSEAMVKKAALLRCRDAYILSDSSKFNQICPVTFAEFFEANIITTKIKDNTFKQYNTILETNSMFLSSN